VASIPRFGEVLRRYRLAAGVTQEELALRAQLSPHAISDLERGARNRPYRETIRLLADALKLSPRDRAALEDAARRPSESNDGTPPSSRSPSPPSRTWPALPTPLTSLIGRDRERAVVEELLRQADVRLVTLTGFGGVGKTRLAIEVARDLARDFGEDVAFVSLESLQDVALVGATIAQALEIQESGGRRAWDNLAAVLHDRRALLVLDNFEHVLGATAALSRLLAASVGVKALVTSRAPLRLPGEHEVYVSPLAIPGLEAELSVADARQFAAVELFAERAHAVRTDFALTPTNAATVAAICARLDGIPLAIELAAARVKALTITQIARRLDDRFALLTDGSRSAPRRQQTLRATMDWSFDLLTEPEKVLCRRLAIFAGGFTLEAVEDVCAGEPLAGPAVLWSLAQLVDQSFVTVEGRDGEIRYRLLETVRQYAEERLDEAGERERLGDRHLTWALSLAEAAASEILGKGQATWLRILEAETDNLRAALAGGLQRGSPAAVRLAARLWLPWYSLGQVAEGCHWLEAVLDRPIDDLSQRAQVLLGLGFLRFTGGRPGARAVTEESLRAFRAWHDRRHSGWALQNLGQVAKAEGQLGEARACLEQSVADFREAGDAAGLGLSLRDLAVTVAQGGDGAQAEKLFEQSLVVLREQGDHWNLGWTMHHLAGLWERRGEVDRARAGFAEALGHFQAVRFKSGIASASVALARHDLRRGLLEQARSHLGEALTQSRDSEPRAVTREALQLSGIIAIALGDVETGLRIVAAATSPGFAVTPSVEDPSGFDATLTRARSVLSEEDFAQIWAEGRLLSHADAIRLAWAYAVGRNAG
jgi:predicted ATPase/DNA-binding XRE family transcriptional regulator